MPRIVHLDYETRSKADIASVGAYRYACDPSTEIMLAGVSEDAPDAPVYLWVNPKFEKDEVQSEPEALDLLRSADLIYAHNAPFEVAITWGRGEQDLGWTFPKIEMFRCTAAMARKAGLPYSLEKLAETLGLTEQKDKRGKELIRLFSCFVERGRGKNKTPPRFTEPQEDPTAWKEFADYCRQDVRTEKAAHRKLAAFELTGDPLETFLFDLRMNHRGIPVNVQALKHAQVIVDEVMEDVSEEFRRLTGLNPTQREKVRQWLQQHGAVLPDMQTDTREELDVSIFPPRAQRALTLYRQVSFAAVKKVRTFLDWVCPDGRVRGTLLYYGAGTGRWSATGPQVQNAKKPTKAVKKIADRVFRQIELGIHKDALALVYGDPFELVACCIRNFIGYGGVYDADYNAIEGRIACWIAGQNDILDCWRRGEDLYKRAAAFVEGKKESEILNPSPERDFGKVVELACQFGLGIDGFIRTCANFGIQCDEAKAKRSVHGYYRPTHQKIVARWYMHDDWMRDAIANPGRTCGVYVVRRVAGINYLLMRLPSGRSLAYPWPEINRRAPTEKERKEMAAGKNYPDRRFLEVSYWGQDIVTKQWGRVKTHGAKQFENEVQAIAADCMSYGARVAESREMPPFMLVHDQGLASAVPGRNAADFEIALATLPPWAKGLPLKVESKLAPYYRK